MKLQRSRTSQFGGHRGLRLSYPDNSLEGIKAAARVADFIEIDVRRSSDGKMVLSHDPTVGDLVVADHDWEELREIDLGDGYRPALLDDVLAALPDAPLDIEIKNFPEQPGFDPDGDFAVEVAGRARPTDVVTCFFWPTMDVVKRSHPHVRTGLLVYQSGSVADTIEAALRGGHDVIAPHFSLLVASNLREIQVAHDAGLEVVTWTVNDRDIARRFVDAGIDGIITDDPVRIRQGVTMSIQEELAAELRDALRSKDGRRKDVIRAVQTEIARARSEPGFKGEADDAFCQAVIASFVKKMDKSKREYESYGERGAEMVEKLGYEVEYLGRWLPKTLDEPTTLAVVQSAIAELSASDPKESGKVVGFIMKSHKGEVDGALVNRLVRSELE